MTRERARSRPERPARRTTRWRRRLPRRLAWLALFLALAALGLYSVRELVLAPWLVSLGQRLVAERLGAELAVGRLSGSWLFGVRLEGVSYRAGRDGDPLRVLAADRIELAYAPWRLVRSGLAGIERVRARGLELELDLRGGESRASSGASTGTGAGPRMPEFLPELDLRARRIDIAFEGGALAARGAALLGGHDAPLELVASESHLSLPGVAERGGTFVVRATYRHALVSELVLALADEVLVRDGRADLSQLGAGELPFGLTLAALGGSARIDAHLAPGTFGARCVLRGAELARLADELRRPPPAPLAGRLDAEASVELPLAPGARGLRAELSLAGTDLAYGDHTVERGRARATLVTDASGMVVGVEELALDAGLNHLTGSALAMPLAPWLGGAPQATLAQRLATLRGRVELDLGDLGQLFVDAETAARVPPGRLFVTAQLDERGAELADGRFESAGGALRLGRGRLEWGPRLADTELALELAARIHDLAGVVAPFVGEEHEGYRGRLEGAVRVHGPVRAPSGAFDLSGQDLQLAGRALGDVTLVAQASAGRVDVDSLQAEGEYGRLSASGSLSLVDGVLDGVVIDAELASLERAVATFTSPAAAADFGGGRLELSARLHGPWSRPLGTLLCVGTDLELFGQRLETLTAEAVSGPDAIRVERLVARLAPGARAPAIALDAAGALEFEGRRLAALALERARVELGGASLALTAPGRMELVGGALRVAALELADQSGGTLSAALTSEAGQLVLSASPRAFHPLPFLRPWLAADAPWPALDALDGELALELVGPELALDVDLALAGLQWPAPPVEAGDEANVGGGASWIPRVPFDARVRGRLGDGRIELTTLELVAGSGHRLSLSGGAPFAPLAEQPLPDGEVTLAGEVAFPFEAGLGNLAPGTPPPPAEVLHARIAMSGAWDAVVARVDLDGASSGATFVGRATLADGRLSLEETHLDLPERMKVALDGSVQLADSGRCDLRAWLAGQAIDWSNAPLDLTLELDAPDVSFITGLSPGLRRLQGAASARLALAGSYDAPELSGEAQLAGIDLRLLEGGRSVEQCTGHLTFSGTRVQLLDLAGTYGAGPVRASGWIDFARGAQQLDLEIEGEELLLARGVGLRLRGDSKLRVHGSLEALHASGTLALREGRYTRSFELFGGLAGRTAPPRARGRGIELFSLRDEPFASMTLDVQVTARDPFLISNNVVRAEIRPDLRLFGTGRAPELAGTLFIDDGRVSLPACKLDVTSGSVVFRRSDPLVPYLDFVGLARLRGYEVTMHASGPYEDAKLVFTAIPPLSEEQARVLVLTGQTPEEALTAEGGLRTAQSVATFVGTDLIGHLFGGEGGGDESWMDRFELEAGTEVSRAGVEAYRASFRLTGVGHRTRTPGQATYLRAEQDVYERMIFGLRFLFRLW